MNPLDQLKDIHLPESVSFWPPAPGWWILAILLLVLVASAFFGWLNYRTKRAAARDAMTLLKQLTSKDSEWPVQMNQILKRAALSYFKRDDVASLHMENWVNFMAMHLPDTKKPAFTEAMNSLQSALYQTPDQRQALAFTQLQQQSEIWLRTALPPKKPLQEVVNV